MGPKSPIDTKRAFRIIVGKAPKRDELVLTFHRKGEVYAVVYLTMKKGRIPFRGRIRSGNLDIFISPKELFAIAKRAKQIVFMADDQTRAHKEVLEGIFPWVQPLWARPCRFCLLKGTVKFPKRSVKYGHDKICIDCAKSQLTKEAQSKGWKASEANIEHMGRLLEKVVDYDVAARALSQDYDPDRPRPRRVPQLNRCNREEHGKTSDDRHPRSLKTLWGRGRIQGVSRKIR
jgi:superfamily II helicase